MTTQESKTGKTPNGGVRSTAFYQDDQGKPADKNKATQVMFVEFDKNDKVINRTYGTFSKNKDQ